VALGWGFSAKAAPMGVDKDNDVIASTTTSDEDEIDQKDAQYTRVETGTDDDVTFGYFLTSGYAATDISNIPSIGKVVGTPELDASLSTAKSLYVLVLNEKTKLDLGEKLIVFGDVGSLREKKSGFNKRFVKNFAILKVREGIGRRYLADVVTSYDLIPAGSPVKLYSGEKILWDKAQVAKEPPTHSIKCYVAGGERGRDAWNQTDYLILTAGTKQDVTEGLTFELWETSLNKNGKVDGISRGFAKVFYTGSNYCLARIQSGSSSISSGFEAIYKP
jgi:hypothetical protein